MKAKDNALKLKLLPKISNKVGEFYSTPTHLKRYLFIKRVENNSDFFDFYQNKGLNLFNSPKNFLEFYNENQLSVIDRSYPNMATKNKIEKIKKENQNKPKLNKRRRINKKNISYSSVYSSFSNTQKNSCSLYNKIGKLNKSKNEHSLISDKDLNKIYSYFDEKINNKKIKDNLSSSNKNKNMLLKANESMLNNQSETLNLHKKTKNFQQNLIKTLIL